MRRWAAGRAGGRPAADGPALTGTRGRRPRTLPSFVASFVASFAALAVLGAPMSVLAPAAHAAPAVHAAPSDDDTTDPGRPVRIDVGRLEPRSVTKGAAVTVTGTLTNSGQRPISKIAVRLQRGDRLTSRAQVAKNDDPDTTVTAAFKDVAGTLKPGQKLPFAYSVPSADLHLDRDGVYPLLLNVNGTVDGSQRRVGEIRTFLVQEPVAPAARITVAWLWPLTERSHRDASGGFADDGLTTSVETGGRLDQALQVIERLPTTVPEGGGEPVPVMPVTLAIDPALVEELTIMAAGPYAVHGAAGAGKGTEAAQAFLARLRKVAALHQVVALPYGDVDADSLVGAGLGAVVTRSLPASGTAEAAHPGDTAAPTTAAPTVDGTPAARETGVGARILRTALDKAPRTDLAWAQGGSLRPDTVATLQRGGIDLLVLGPGGLTAGPQAVGTDGGAAAARATLSTKEGALQALVADPALGDVVGTAERATGGPRIAEQRYLAELAVQGSQARPGTVQTVLVAPPRDATAGLDGAGAMLADTASTPWLRPGTLDIVLSGPAARAGTLADPVDAVRLDPTGLAQVGQAVRARDDLARAVVEQPDTALSPLDAATARATSVAWRDDADGFRAAADDLTTTVGRLREKVTLVAPADGTYSLASSDSPLILTVRNDLPFAVKVRLDVRTRGNRGLDISDIGPQELPPLQRTTLQVPTHLRQSGGFAVFAGLTTPGGAPLGDRITLQVKSTAYGWISLGITIGAALLLGLLFLRRLVRFLLRRRRAVPEEEFPPAPEGAAVPMPPTRSPV